MFCEGHGYFLDHPIAYSSRNDEQTDKGERERGRKGYKGMSSRARKAGEGGRSKEYMRVTITLQEQVRNICACFRMTTQGQLVGFHVALPHACATVQDRDPLADCRHQ